MARNIVCLGLVLVAVVAVGCDDAGSSGSSGQGQGSPAAQADGKKFLLDAEPAGARGVLDIKKDAKDGDDVVVVGQVGGSTKPFTESRAAFLIVDPSLKPTFECHTPWDFCEATQEDLNAARASVKFVDAQGKTLQSGARELFGIKELSVVVVKGNVSRDDKGNFAIIGSGIFVRKDK